MGAETPYQRIPVKFGLHVPNVITRDANDANANFREIERVVNALPFNAVIVVTSTTRPTPVNVGTVIYETDTGKVLIWNGTSWVTVFDPTPIPWVTFTTTWSGTIGNGSFTNKYQQVGKTVHWRINTTWGTTTSHPASGQLFTLPVAPHADYTLNFPVGIAVAHNVGVAAPTGTCIRTSVASQFTVEDDNTNAGWSNAAPFAWGNTDQGMLSGTYEAA